MRALIVFALLASCASSSNPPPAPPPSSEPAADPNAPPKGKMYGGTLAPVEVKKALVARKDDVRACYHALLEKNKKASGKVVIRFTVGEDGAVEEAVVMNETTLPNETASCIAEVVKTTKFPKPEGGKARITYPWEFTAE
ncbi:MAG: TonB family protein [Polyangiales bacterium]